MLNNAQCRQPLGCLHCCSGLRVRFVQWDKKVGGWEEEGEKGGGCVSILPPGRRIQCRRGRWMALQCAFVHHWARVGRAGNTWLASSSNLWCLGIRTHRRRWQCGFKVFAVRSKSGCTSAICCVVWCRWENILCRDDLLRLRIGGSRSTVNCQLWYKELKSKAVWRINRRDHDRKVRKYSEYSIIYFVALWPRNYGQSFLCMQQKKQTNNVLQLTNVQFYRGQHFCDKLGIFHVANSDVSK